VPGHRDAKNNKNMQLKREFEQKVEQSAQRLDDLIHSMAATNVDLKIALDDTDASVSTL